MSTPTTSPLAIMSISYTQTVFWALEGPTCQGFEDCGGTSQPTRQSQIIWLAALRHKSRHMDSKPLRAGPLKALKRSVRGSVYSYEYIIYHGMEYIT